MYSTIRQRTFLHIAYLAVAASVIVGCQPVAQEKVQSTPPVSAETKASVNDNSNGEPQRIAGKQLAMQAKDVLAQRLAARLAEAMSSGGPAAAIQVCSQEANVIATQVGEELGVKIGRTSFKLRNSKNTPPSWAQSFVDEKLDTPHFQKLEEGTTAALLPIRLQPQCLACHGDPTAMPKEIRTALSMAYPQDAATGFAEGDLRGWFWIEVPTQD